MDFVNLWLPKNCKHLIELFIAAALVSIVNFPIALNLFYIDLWKKFILIHMYLFNLIS